METEFWGVEVKSGETLKVSPGYGRILHLSQASLGGHKNEKGKESVSLFVNVDEKNLVLATLITNKLPQHQFDLLFDRDFELSHDWTSGSVYFYGYKASNSCGEDESLEGESDESDSEEDIPVTFAYNGKREPNVKQEKSESNANQEKPESNAEQEKPESKAMQEKPVDSGSGAPNEKSDADRDSVKIVQTHNVMNPQEDEGNSYEDILSEVVGEDNAQVETSKKRAVESTTETPDPNKKAKVTPHETDSNKTEPHPGNNDLKNPADNSVTQPPKRYPCKICKKLFGTEQGVEAHTKAKHGDVGTEQGVEAHAKAKHVDGK